MKDPEYFERYFEEAQLPYQAWNIQVGTTMHHVDSNVVIENIKAAPPAEQAAIRAMMVRIDFKAGDMNHYLEHLAKCMVTTWEAQRQESQGFEAYVNSN